MRVSEERDALEDEDEDELELEDEDEDELELELDDLRLELIPLLVGPKVDTYTACQKGHAR